MERGETLGPALHTGAAEIWGPSMNRNNHASSPLLSPTSGGGGSGGSSAGAFPGAFDDEPIPLSHNTPQPVQPKLPNAFRPRDPQPVGPQPVPRAITPAPVPAAPAAVAAAEAPPKIRAFEQRISGKHEDKGWNRTPNVSGHGAIHVRSFHCKLNSESLEFLDQQINEWLDAHPQYEVKFVTTGVGDWVGKVKEPNLIVQVWV